METQLRVPYGSRWIFKVLIAAFGLAEFGCLAELGGDDGSDGITIEAGKQCPGGSLMEQVRTAMLPYMNDPRQNPPGEFVYSTNSKVTLVPAQGSSGSINRRLGALVSHAEHYVFTSSYQLGVGRTTIDSGAQPFFDGLEQLSNTRSMTREGGETECLGGERVLVALLTAHSNSLVGWDHFQLQYNNLNARGYFNLPCVDFYLGYRPWSAGDNIHNKQTVVDGRVSVIGSLHIQEIGGDSNVCVEGVGVASGLVNEFLDAAHNSGTRWLNGRDCTYDQVGCAFDGDHVGEVFRDRFGGQTPASEALCTPSFEGPMSEGGLPVIIASQVGAQLPEKSTHNMGNMAYYSAIDSACHEIRIKTPNFNEPEVLRRLLRAVDREVRVTMVTRGENDELNDAMDAAKTVYGLGCGRNTNCAKWIYRCPTNRRCNEWLGGEMDDARELCENFDLRFSGELSHSKFMSVDGQLSLIGSYNLDAFSFRSSREASIVVDSDVVARSWDSRIVPADPESDSYGHWPESREILCGRPPGEATPNLPRGKSPRGFAEPFQWAVVDGAAYYRIYVRNVATGEALVNQWVAANAVCDGGLCKFTPDVAYPIIGHYEWYLQTANPAGLGPWYPSSDQRGIEFFQFQPPEPVFPNSEKPIDTSLLAPTFSWRAHEDGLYRVVVVRDSDQRIVVDEGGLPCAASTESLCSLPLDGIEEWSRGATSVNGAYTWWVGYYEPTNQEVAGWSQPQAFTVATPAAGVATLTAPNPEENLGMRRPIVRFSPGAGSTWHRVRVVNGAGQDVYNQWHAARDICSTRGCELQPAATLGDGRHQVAILSWGPGGLSGESTAVGFVVDRSADVLSPGAITSDATPLIRWQRPVGTTSTGVYIWNASDWRLEYAEVSSLDSLTAPTLQFGKLYQVWTQPYAGQEPGEWSIRAFRICDAARGACPLP